MPKIFIWNSIAYLKFHLAKSRFSGFFLKIHGKKYLFMNSENGMVIDFLSAHPLFSELSAEDIAQMVESTELRRQVPAGEVIFREGDAADSFFIIMRGEVEVVKAGEDGSEHRLRTLKAGKSAGEMALLDPAPRSATVRTVETSDLLLFDLDKYQQNHALQADPQTKVRLSLARELSRRLRHTSDVTVAALEQSLSESKSREELSRFVTIVLITTCAYIFSLGMLDIAKAYMGNTRFLSLGVMLGFSIGLFILIIKSRLPLAAFGITTKNWRRSVWESLIFSILILPVIILAKYLLLQAIPGYSDRAVLEMSSNLPYEGWVFALALSAYSVLVPLQELAVRGGLQSSMQLFLTGKYRVFFSILISNLIFSAGHVYLNLPFALMVFPMGLFWGWLYYRHGTLIGVCLSHILIGNFFLLVVGYMSIL